MAHFPAMPLWTERAKKGRATTADRVLNVLRDLFEVHRRAISQDELARACVEIGIWAEPDPAKDVAAGWRDLRRKVRENLTKHQSEVEKRDDCYALKP